jgi:catecholate siderophore receptor
MPKNRITRPRTTLANAHLPPPTRTPKRTPKRTSTVLLPLGASLFMASAGTAYAQQAPATPPAATKDSALPEVKVTGKRDRESTGYNPGTSAVGKFEQDLKDIPQSVTVVPEQLIHDRNADTLKEALRNVAGLTFNAGEGGRIGDNITLRGYSAVGDLFLDGMRDMAQYNRETFHLQQIDVLRGSASMLFGRGSTGGIINQVTKRPELYDRYEANLTLGSHDYKRVTGDFNKKLGENSALRVNVMGTGTDSFRDIVEQKRWGIAPSVSFGIGTKNELTLAYFQLKEKNIPDYGVPFFQERPLNVALNTFYGLSTDFEKNDTKIATATYTHRFSNDTQLKTQLRKADYQRDLWVTAPRLAGAPAVILPTTVINRGRPARGGDEHTLTAQSDFTSKFDALGMKHQFLAGVELLREKAHRYTLTGPVANPATTVASPNASPALPANYFNITKTADNYYQANSYAFYVQDMIEFAPKWKLLLGARRDTMKADYQRPLPAGPLTRKDNVWSYRTGLIYQPTVESAYYISYGTSFNPSAELYQLDDRSTNTPPEKNRNIEAGAKWDLFGGDLALRTAVFRSEKTNERNTDVASPNLFLLSGRRHTDGVEVEAAGRVTAQWEVFGAVAFMRAKIDEASFQQANTQGKRPVNTPSYTASLWSTYKLAGALQGWKVGGGIEMVGLRYATATNTNALPRYARVDALVEYGRDNWALKLNVFNLYNKKYYEGVYTAHTTPGTPRAFQVTGTLKF